MYVPTYWINAFTLPLILENPIFPYLLHLFPEFGANQIKKSVLDHFYVIVEMLHTEITQKVFEIPSQIENSVGVFAQVRC